MQFGSGVIHKSPLGEPSDSGFVLTEAEKSDLYHKLRVFIDKQGDRFEPL